MNHININTWLSNTEDLWREASEKFDSNIYLMQNKYF